MPVSLEEPPPGVLTIYPEPETQPRHLHVEWGTTQFNCGIVTAGENPRRCDDFPLAAAPVCLRVNETVAEWCRIEFFCAVGFLCGASASCVPL